MPGREVDASVAIYRGTYATQAAFSQTDAAAGSARLRSNSPRTRVPGYLRVRGSCAKEDAMSSVAITRSYDPVAVVPISRKGQGDDCRRRFFSMSRGGGRDVAASHR